MSLVLAAHGYGWVALAGDRGIWYVDSDGNVDNVCSDAKSKLHVVPGYPMVIATVGPGYAGDVVDRYIAREDIAVRRNTFAIAKDLWSELRGYHQERFGRGGESHARAGMQMLVASVDQLGFPRVAIGEFPKEDLDFPSIYHWGGVPQWGTFAAGISAIGANNFEWRAPLQLVGPEKGAEIVRAMLRAVDEVEHIRIDSGETTTIVPPYDIVLITKTGVRWVQGCARGVPSPGAA